jgi:hypothetical protein
MARSGGGFGSGLVVGLFLGIGAAVIFGNQIKGALTAGGSGGIAKSFAATQYAYPADRHIAGPIHTSHWGGIARYNGG